MNTVNTDTDLILDQKNELEENQRHIDNITNEIKILKIKKRFINY